MSPRVVALALEAKTTKAGGLGGKIGCSLEMLRVSAVELFFLAR